MITKKTFLATLFFLLMPFECWGGSVPFTFEMAMSLHETLETFILHFYAVLADKFYVTFKILFALYLCWVGCCTVFQPEGFNPWRSIKVGFALMLAIGFVGTHAFFFDWIYRPLIDTVYDLTSFSIQESVGATPSSKPLYSLFKNIDHTIAVMHAVAEKISDKAGLFSTTKWSLLLQGIVLQVVYFALVATFTVMFVMGIVSVHILLAIMPVVIPLGVFPGTRSVFKGAVKGIFHYALIPIFAAIAMSITLFVMHDLTESGEMFLKSTMDEDVPEGFYIKAILYGIFSVFLQLKSAEFASIVLGGAQSGVSSVFGWASGMGGSMARSGRRVKEFASWGTARMAPAKT